MDKQTILATLTPEVVERFKVAIELGKWPDGRALSDEQRQTCMQAVMIWEHEHLPPSERTGYIHKPIKDNGDIVGAECDVEHEHHYPNMPNPKGAIQPVKFRDK
ncbi:YeaC family protein [Psychrobacter sp. DM8]|uniref:YeaC family protein n=1 Tax=Psychrobacter sp. DM8 TaxID=3440636 RepID=UPI003F4F7FEC